MMPLSPARTCRKLLYPDTQTSSMPAVGHNHAGIRTFMSLLLLAQAFAVKLWVSAQQIPLTVPSQRKSEMVHTPRHRGLLLTCSHGTIEAARLASVVLKTTSRQKLGSTWLPVEVPHGTAQKSYVLFRRSLQNL